MGNAALGALDFAPAQGSLARGWPNPLTGCERNQWISRLPSRVEPVRFMEVFREVYILYIKPPAISKATAALHNAQAVLESHIPVPSSLHHFSAPALSPLYSSIHTENRELLLDRDDTDGALSTLHSPLADTHLAHHCRTGTHKKAYEP